MQAAKQDRIPSGEGLRVGVEVRGRPAHVDETEIGPARLGGPDPADELEDGQRRRPGIATGLADDGRQSLAVDDPLEEDLPDDFAGRLDLDRPDLGHDVIGGGRRLAVEQGQDPVADLGVAGIEDERGGRGPAQELRVAEDDGRIASVGAPGEEDDVGLEGFEAGDLVGRELIGIRPDDLASGRIRGHPGDRKSQVGRQPESRDLKTASGGGGQVNRKFLRPSAAGAEFLPDPAETDGQVVGRRRRLGPGEKPESPRLQGEQGALGVGRPDVDRGEGRGRHGRLAAAISAFSILTTSARSTWGRKTRLKPMSKNFFSTSS